MIFPLLMESMVLQLVVVGAGLGALVPLLAVGALIGLVVEAKCWLLLLL